MRKKFITQNIKYDGSQLRPLYAYEKWGLLGPSIISWRGACDIHLDHMIDLEDKIVNSKICGDEMLHFLIEYFNPQLFSAVCLQRLFAAIVQTEIFKLNSSSKIVLKNKLSPRNLIREGDDLFFIKGSKKYKLSISIASISPVSNQIHFAMNIVNTGTPVPTSSLKNIQVDPILLSKNIMNHFAFEYESIVQATQKVRPLSG